MTEKNLWCCMACSSPLFELLHEHLADHYVILIFEDSTEHNCYTISLRLNIPVTVIMYLQVNQIHLSPKMALLTVTTSKEMLTQLLQGSCQVIHNTVAATKIISSTQPSPIKLSSTQ
jgi:hypothetical protein